jgi:serine protease Do
MASSRWYAQTLLVTVFCGGGAADAQTNSLRSLSSGIRELVQRASPAVVQIDSLGIAAAEGSSPRLEASHSTGSGVLVDAGGYIVTNAHVVGNARRVRVTLSQNAVGPERVRSVVKPAGKIYEAKVAGIDRETDVAVLKIAAAGLPHLRFADSEAIHQGDFVFAAGSPFGLDNSISMGIVSSVARQVRPDDTVIYIQTDASINPGNSGGPLLDSDGNIAGINTFILSQSGGNEGVGFAVPSNIVQAVYKQIREHGRVRRGQIGVIAQTINSALAAALGLKQDWGVVIADVSPGSAAEAAGIEIKDVVLALNGKTMENSRQFGVNIYRYAGETITLELLRGEQKLEKQVAVLDRPRDPDRLLSLLEGETNMIRKLGILAVELDEKVTPLLPALRRLSGVVVAGQALGTPDRRENLLPGDVIYECNNRRVRNIAELRSILEEPGTANPAALHIERQGQLQFLLLDLE